MAGNDGKLTEAQRQVAIKWVTEKAPRMTCSACGTNNFGLMEHFVHPPIFYGGGNVIIGGSAYPQFGIVCNNCSHVVFFSAVTAGLIKKDGNGNGE